MPSSTTTAAAHMAQQKQKRKKKRKKEKKKERKNSPLETTLGGPGNATGSLSSGDDDIVDIGEVENTAEMK